MTQDLWQDVRVAWRGLRSMGAGGALAIVTLAVGFGATTAMFSVVYAALLRPVPFDSPDQLVMVWLTRSSPAATDSRVRFSFDEFTALRDQATSFEALGSFTRTNNVAIEIRDQAAIPVSGEFVSAEYWTALRQQPMLGRWTGPDDDDRRGTGAVAVLSARLWRQRAAADARLVGRTIRVNGVPLSVIGILPDTFTGLSERADIWMPSTIARRLTYADYLTTPQHFIATAGRLAPGVTLDAANRELAALGPRVASVAPPDADRQTVWSAIATPMNAVRIQPAVRRTALLLTATLTCVLLVVIANVASVIVARAQERRREVAVRRALGAGAWRLARQLLADNAVIAVIAAVGSVPIAAGTIRLIQITGPAALPSLSTGYMQLSSFATPAFDAAAGGFLAAVATTAALLFTLVSAIETSRTSAAAVLRDDARTGARRRLRTLHAVVVAEIAGTVVLVTSAALLVVSARGLERQRAGFDPTGVLTIRVAPPASRYRPEDGPRILDALLSSVQRAPGVALAAVNRCVPLDAGCARATLHLSGRTGGSPVERHYVSADYFRALGIRVLAGRAITESDRSGAPLVTVVNRTAARTFWPGQNAVGQHVWFSNPPGFDDPTHPLEVVGVVDDVKYGTIDDGPLPDFYTSFRQFAFPDSMIVVKAASGAGVGLLAAVTDAIAAVDRGLPVVDPMSLDDRVTSAWATPRFHAAAVVTFAGLALVLAAIGVYGVASVAVHLRAREMGIRLALGAEARTVARLIVREHVVISLIGGALGVATALAASRSLQAMLYGVSATDPRAAGVAVAALACAAIAGAYEPARRAGRVNPAELLRRE